MTDVVDAVNYAFFDAIPIEFLYLDAFITLFGAGIAYYMGCYGLITRFCHPSQWAPRLAAFDGVESCMSLLGNAIAPYVFRKELRTTQSAVKLHLKHWRILICHEHMYY